MFCIFMGLLHIYLDILDNANDIVKAWINISHLEYWLQV